MLASMSSMGSTSCGNAVIAGVKVVSAAANSRSCRSRRSRTATALTINSAGLASAANAKTLTFCASGNPEGFDPAPHTAAVTFDASSGAIYDRLVAFEKGTTKPIQSLANPILKPEPRWYA